MQDSEIERNYQAAREQYAEVGVDTGAALEFLRSIPLSLHCWQGDDVGGFEGLGQAIGGGLAVTGNYPGRARTPDELRGDLEFTYSLLPGTHRLNLHASYGEFGNQRVERDEIETKHYQGWIDWAKRHQLSLDFNPTYFAHEKAADGFTLAHLDAGVRDFWIDHGIACREVAAAMGAAQGNPCVNNVWIPDGMKDTPVDRLAPRQRLLEALDRMFAKDYPDEQLRDAVECKLFGLGSESYVVGSHEFYLGYAISRQKTLCLDAGHFHPTETIADKISAVMSFVPSLLLHVSRGVRWDSDHVVILNDELTAIAQELVRCDVLDRTHVGLDFFDASINRVAAWSIGARNMIKALLFALLDPLARLRMSEEAGDFTQRLALLERTKTMPRGAVWDYYCLTASVPTEACWYERLRGYESKILATRD